MLNAESKLCFSYCNNLNTHASLFDIHQKMKRITNANQHMQIIIKISEKIEQECKLIHKHHLLPDLKKCLEDVKNF